MYNYDNLGKNLFNYFHKDIVDDEIIKQLFNNAKEDKDYLWEDCKEITPDNLHKSFKRLVELSDALVCEKSKYYNNENLFNCIVYSINVLSKHFNKNTRLKGNWWYWRIGMPYMYSLVELNLCFYEGPISYDYIIYYENGYKNFKETIKKFLRNYIPFCDLTYANLASACRNLYIAGVITENEDWINSALRFSIPAFKGKSPFQIKLARFLQKLYVNCSWLPYTIKMFSGKEGLYEDYSFLQHTSVPYIGTYGVEIIEFASLIFKTSINTGINIPKDIENGIPKWIRAYNIATYNDEMMVMYCGRSIGECSPKGIVKTIDKYIKNILGEDIDWIIKNDFAMVQSNADKVIYQHDGWRFGISMCSDRVCKYENFNNQNNTGWHQNLGMHYLYTPGCTFEHYVNDDKGKGFLLPGVTCQTFIGQKIKNSEQPRFNYTRDDMKHLRSGGCKIDKNAVAAMMQVVDNGMFARKSWFMIDDTIYCIGTALKGELDYLFTTIYNGDKEIKLLDEHTAFIEDFGTVTCKTNELKIKGNILYIYNYHCYEYTITPLKQLENYNYPYENVTRYYDQYVHTMHSTNNNENKYLFNFWRAGHVEIGDVTLDSNRDLVSVGLQKFNNGDMYLMISDITQENKNVTITINGKYLPNSYGVTDFKYKNIVKDGKDYTEIKINTKNSFGKNKILFLIK